MLLTSGARRSLVTTSTPQTAASTMSVCLGGLFWSPVQVRESSGDPADHYLRTFDSQCIPLSLFLIKSPEIISYIYTRIVELLGITAIADSVLTS